MTQKGVQLRLWASLIRWYHCALTYALASRDLMILSANITYNEKTQSHPGK